MPLQVGMSPLSSTFTGITCLPVPRILSNEITETELKTEPFLELVSLPTVRIMTRCTQNRAVAYEPNVQHQNCHHHQIMIRTKPLRAGIVSLSSAPDEQCQSWLRHS